MSESTSEWHRISVNPEFMFPELQNSGRVALCTVRHKVLDLQHCAHWTDMTTILACAFRSYVLVLLCLPWVKTLDIFRPVGNMCQYQSQIWNEIWQYGIRKMGIVTNLSILVMFSFQNWTSSLFWAMPRHGGWNLRDWQACFYLQLTRTED